MKIKGHTSIELRNVKTGEIEKFEDDNMVTNALNYYLKDLGMLGRTPLMDNELRNNPITALMGGLLLLDTALDDTSADNILCPGGVKMVGNGAYNVTANGQDGVTELGSYNATNSGWMSDGSFKMEWDFTQEQANGTINCACLTSANHGYIGEGNTNPTGSSKAEKRSDYSLGGTPQEYNLDANSDTVKRLINVSFTDSTATWVDYYNLNYDATYADQHMSQTGKLKVYTQKIPLTKLDLRQSLPMGNSGGQPYVPITTTEITLPSGFVTQLGSATPFLAGRHGNSYYLLAKSLNGLTVNSSVQGVKIDCSTLIATGFTITNTLSDTMVVSSGEGGVMFGNGKVAVVCAYGATMSTLTSGVMYQNISDNVVTTFVQVDGITSGDRQYKSHMNEKYAMFFGNKIDFVDSSVLPVNGAEAVNMGSQVSNDNPLIESYIPYDNGYWRPTTFRLFHSTNYLATINNLQASVTKSSDKSMKVTYVLRFDDGE